MSIDNLWTAGGVVSIPLLGFSLLAIALIIERRVFWWRIRNKQRRVVKEVLSLYRGDRFAAIGKPKQNAQLPIARIFLEAMELEQPTPDEFRLALDSGVQAEIAVLKKFSTWFQTIITASPLLGLLGTIIGLIQSFSAMDLGNAAATNSAGVTGGLSEALASTVMGLVVAIFTLLFASQPIELDNLKGALSEKIKPDSESVVVINADTKVEHGTVVKVMDRLRQVPGARMAIATERE